MQTDNNISKYKCTEWLSDHIGLRHLAYASLTSFMQTYFQSNTSIHIFHKHFMNKKEIKQLSVLSQDFSPLSTPRTEQQKGDSSVIHLLVFSETCHSPGLTYPVHVREVGGGLTMTFLINKDLMDCSINQFQFCYRYSHILPTILRFSLNSDLITSLALS